MKAAVAVIAIAERERIDLQVRMVSNCRDSALKKLRKGEAKGLQVKDPRRKEVGGGCRQGWWPAGGLQSQKVGEKSI